MLKSSALFRTNGVPQLFFTLAVMLFTNCFTGFSQVSATFDIPDLDQLTRRPKTSFRDSISLIGFCNELQIEAYAHGFLTFSIDSIQRTDSLHFRVTGNVGSAFKAIMLHTSDETRALLRKSGIAPRSWETIAANPKEVARLINDLLQHFSKNGHPFARTGLSDFRIEKNLIHATLQVEPGMEVRWTAIHLTEGKKGISERFIENYLHIRSGELFSQEDVRMIPLRLKQITYLHEIKPAELLFTEQGAELFLYMESKPVSLFNGTVGLQQNPIKLTYQLTGDLRLKLQNSLRHGELFDLNWRSIQGGSQQLKIQLSYPFVFNTPFGTEGQFQLFKRDSTFLELKSMIGVNYFLSAGNTLKAFYRNGSSSLLGSTSSSALYGSVKSNQYGLSVTHQAIDYLPNPQKGLLWTIEGSAGQRKMTKDTVVTKALIFSTRLHIEGYIPIGKRHVIKLASITESFYTDSIQQNELMRFGGNLSQRGFMEDELLASTRTTATLEYRFLLDRNSFLFAFFDQSWYERHTMSYLHDHPMGFGAGLSFGTNIGIFSLTYALGKQQQNPILLRDSKIHFGYIAYF